MAFSGSCTCQGKVGLACELSCYYEINYVLICVIEFRSYSCK